MKVSRCRIDGVVLQRVTYDAVGQQIALTAVLTVNGLPAMTFESAGTVPTQLQEAWSTFATAVEKTLADSIGTPVDAEKDSRDTEPKSLIQI